MSEVISYETVKEYEWKGNLFWILSLIALIGGAILIFAFMITAPVSTMDEFIIVSAIIFGSLLLLIILTAIIFYVSTRYLHKATDIKKEVSKPFYDKGCSDYLSHRQYNPGTVDEYEISRYREGWLEAKSEIEIKTPRNI